MQTAQPFPELESAARSQCRPVTASRMPEATSLSALTRPGLSGNLLTR